MAASTQDIENKPALTQKESATTMGDSASEFGTGKHVVPGAHTPALHGIKEEEDIVGYKEYKEGQDIVMTEAESRRVRWKIDAVVMPMFLITQGLQFMDRTALNYANLFGYQKALNLQGTQFNYLSAMVYAGYFFGQYPCGYLIGKYKAPKVLGVAVMLWGLLVLLMTQCHSYSGAMVLRFFMGFFEAAATPGMTLMTGYWYTRREVPLRQCIWYSALGWGGMVGSYMSTGLSKLSDDGPGPAKWQLIFYILGGATMAWSIVIYFFLPDSPSNAYFLKPHERVIAVKRVAANEYGVKNKHFDKSQAILSFYDPKVILLFICVFAAAVPNGVVNSFSTIIIRDMGFGVTRTTELKSVGDAVQIISLLIGGTIMLNVKNSRLAVATGANLLCTIAAALTAFLPRSNTWGRLVSFWLVNAQSVGFNVTLMTISSNMGGYTHRSFASGMIFTAYCWGNFAGPFVVRPDQAPRYIGASIGLLVGYAIKLVTHLMLWGYMVWSNRQRDRKYGPADHQKSQEAGMRDETEYQNMDFRYVY